MSLNNVLAVIVAVVGAFMAVLDTTIVDIVIPKLKGPLSTDLYGVQWIVTAYMLSAAVSLLMSDYLIGRFGRKKVYLVSVAIFSFASLMCGLANDLGFMIFWRVIQGIGEAAIMVSAQIMVFSLFKNKGLAMGVFALGVAFAPAIGPTLGGYLSEWVSWRAVFFINVPIGVFVVVVGMVVIEDLKEEGGFLNFVSLTFLAVFTIALLIILSQGQQWGWSSEKIVYLGFVSLISFILFGVSEVISKKTLFNYEVFKNPYVVLGFLIYFVLLGFSMYQYFYLLPIFYEQLKGFSSIDAGIGIFGFGVWIGIFGIIAGILSDKFSPMIVLNVAGVIYVFTTLFLLPTINYYTPFYESVLKTIPFGIAMGMFFAPITTMIMQKAKELKSQAVIIMDYVRFVGGSFGTAIATNTLLFHKERNFEGMNVLASGHTSYDFLDLLYEKFGFLSDEVMRNFDNFFAMNYAFKNVWINAGLWGAFGSLFVFGLLLIKEKK